MPLSVVQTNFKTKIYDTEAHKTFKAVSGRKLEILNKESFDTGPKGDYQPKSHYTVSNYIHKKRHLFHFSQEPTPITRATRTPGIRDPALSTSNLLHPVLPALGIFSYHWLAESPIRPSASPRYTDKPTRLICPQTAAPSAPLTSPSSKMAGKEGRGPTAWPYGKNFPVPPSFRHPPRTPEKHATESVFGLK